MTQRTTAPSGRPLPGEYAPYAQADIDSVPGTDAATVLAALAVDTLTFLESLAENQVCGLRYAPAKWTLKDVLGHVIDDERIFTYRAFCLARGETKSLAGFDEKVYAANADAENRRWRDLLDEYRVVRAASVALFCSLRPAAWERAGEVNGYRATPRGLAFHIAGHELHHLRIVRERYLPLAPIQEEVTITYSPMTTASGETNQDRVAVARTPWRRTRSRISHGEPVCDNGHGVPAISRIGSALRYARWG